MVRFPFLQSLFYYFLENTIHATISAFVLLNINSPAIKKFIRQISIFFKIGEEFEGLRILTNITLKTAIVLILPFYCDIIGSY